MTDPREPHDAGSAPPEPDERWAKWDRWRAGEPMTDPAAADPAGAGERRGVPWRAREGFAIFFIHLLAAAVLTIPFAVAFRDQDTVTALAILMTEISLLGTTLLWIRARYGAGPRDLGVRGFTVKNVAVGVGAAVGGLIVASIIGGILYTIVEAISGTPVQDPDQIPLVDEPSGALLWIVGISVVVLAPIAEEMFFRGFVYASLRRWARPWPAVTLSAVAFAIPHVQWQVLAPIFGLGVILAWVVEKRRSLVPAIAAHMVFNLFGFLVMFVL